MLMTDYTIEQKDIDLLRAQGMSEADVDHSIKVAEKATVRFPENAERASFLVIEEQQMLWVSF